MTSDVCDMDDKIDANVQCGQNCIAKDMFGVCWKDNSCSCISVPKNVMCEYFFGAKADAICLQYCLKNEFNVGSCKNGTCECVREYKKSLTLNQMNKTIFVLYLICRFALNKSK